MLCADRAGMLVRESAARRRGSWRARFRAEPWLVRFASSIRRRKSAGGLPRSWRAKPSTPRHSQSAEAFLAQVASHGDACVVAPSNLPGMGTRALIELVARPASVAPRGGVGTHRRRCHGGRTRAGRREPVCRTPGAGTPARARRSGTRSRRARTDLTRTPICRTPQHRQVVPRMGARIAPDGAPRGHRLRWIRASSHLSEGRDEYQT